MFRRLPSRLDFLITSTHGRNYSNARSSGGHGADLEGGQGLEEARAVERSRGVGVLEHLLGELAEELGAHVAEVRLDVDELLEVVELAVHLEDADLLVEPGVRSVGHLDARVGARELAAARHPGDGGALVEEVGRLEGVLALGLDEAHLEDLALVVVHEIGGEHLDDDVAVRALGGDVGLEVRLAGLDGGLDGLQAVSALLHVTLDLPRELDVVADVEIDAEVDELLHAIVGEGVQTLDDDNRGRHDLLRLVQGAVDVVVDGLLDGLSPLERGNVLVHEVEALLRRVQGGLAGLLAALAVVQVVVVQADHGGLVADERVGLPAAVAEAAAKRSDLISAEDLREAAHEGALAAAGVGGHADHHHGLVLAEFGEQRCNASGGAGAGHRGTERAGHEGHGTAGKRKQSNEAEHLLRRKGLHGLRRPERAPSYGGLT
eukprot:scaffold2893_cov254-Pinguiococcus_pyrenoidosus.AAC.22